MTFYPTPEYEGHINVEKQLKALCVLNNWKLEDCKTYYSEGRLELAQIFTEEALLERSKPDKHLFTKSGMYIIDLKSTFRKDTGNIAIELSSFYFSWKKYDSLYAYIAENGVLKFFSPKYNNPHTIIAQSQWEKNLFFAKAINELQQKARGQINIYNKNTSGSGDPFVLLEKKAIIHNEIK